MKLKLSLKKEDKQELTPEQKTSQAIEKLFSMLNSESELNKNRYEEVKKMASKKESPLTVKSNNTENTTLASLQAQVNNLANYLRYTRGQNRGITVGVGNNTGGTTSPLTTKGDLFGFSTTNTRIPVGADGLVLTADSTDPNGVRWGANEYVGSGVLTGVDYVTTYSPETPTLNAGLEIIFIPDVTNTGPVTLNGLQIFKYTPTQNSLSAGDLEGGNTYNLTYNGTAWVAQLSGGSANTYRVVQTLVAGPNIINHNLSNSVVIVDVRDSVTGEMIFTRVTNENLNDVTVTVLNPITNAVITIKS